MPYWYVSCLYLAFVLSFNPNRYGQSVFNTNIGTFQYIQLQTHTYYYKQIRTKCWWTYLLVLNTYGTYLIQTVCICSNFVWILFRFVGIDVWIVLELVCIRPWIQADTNAYWMISIQIQTNPIHYVQIHFIPNNVLMNVFACIKYVRHVFNTNCLYWFGFCSYLVCNLFVSGLYFVRIFPSIQTDTR